MVTYITKWVDYSNKYGIGYELANGMAGVLRPDSSTIQLNTYSGSLDMIHYSRNLKQMVLQRVHNIPGQQLRSNESKQLALATSMHSYMDKTFVNVVTETLHALTVENNPCKIVIFHSIIIHLLILMKTTLIHLLDQLNPLYICMISLV